MADMLDKLMDTIESLANRVSENADDFERLPEEAALDPGLMHATLSKIQRDQAVMLR